MLHDKTRFLTLIAC